LVALGAFSPRVAFASVKGTIAIKDVAEPEPEHIGFWHRQTLLVRPAPYDPRPEVVVVIDASATGGDATTPPATKPLLEIIGERIWPPVLPVASGWEVELRNSGRTPQAVTTPEDPDVFQTGAIAKGGTRTAKFAATKVHPVLAVGKPWLHAKILVLPGRWFARVDRDGSFHIDGVPDGHWKVRVFWREGWLKLPPMFVDVSKGSADVPAITLAKDLELEEAAPAAPAAPAPAPAKPNDKGK
jgi:hypothetical protein